MGLDFAMFDIIDGTLELYDMSTTNLLVQRSLPDILGFNYVWDNLGEVNNKGIELSVNSLNMSTEKFSWRTTFNFQLNRNKIKHLYGDTAENGNELDDYETQWFTRRAIDEISTHELAGVSPADDHDDADTTGLSPGHSQPAHPHPHRTLPRTPPT